MGLDKLLKIIRFDKEIRCKGNLNDLIKTLDEISSLDSNKICFYFTKKSDIAYILEPLMTLGTIIIEGDILGRKSVGISIDVKIKSESDKYQIIHCTTKIRPIHYFIAIGFISAILIVTFNNDATWYILLILCGFWVVFHLWFNFVWSSQENGVFKEFRRVLYLKTQFKMNKKL